MGFFEKFRGNKGEPAPKQEVAADAGATAEVAEVAEPKQEGKEQKSYQDIGRQRAENAKAAIGNGLNSLKEKLGSGLGWLAKKAESAVYGALAIPEMGVDATKATYGAAKTAVENTMNTGVVGTRLTIEAGKSAVEAGGRAVKATGEFTRNTLEAAKAGTLRATSAVIEGGKERLGAAGEYIGSQVNDLKKGAGEFRDTLKAEWEQDKKETAEKYTKLAERGVNAAKGAWGKVESAWSTMNNWKNDKRADLASKFSGVDKETLKSVSKLSPEQLQEVMRLASEMSPS